MLAMKIPPSKVQRPGRCSCLLLGVSRMSKGPQSLDAKSTPLVYNAYVKDGSHGCNNTGATDG